MVALIKSFPGTFAVITAGTIAEGTIKILKPVMLMIFLNAIADESTTTEDKYTYASGIALLGIAYVAVHHVLFFYSMRVGWNWRTVTQALVFEHMLSLDSTSLENSSKGNMVNLISNDVDKFERFTVFMMFSVVSPFEIIAILTLLSNALDFWSAMSGMAIILMFLPLEIKMGGEFAKLRTKTAAHTDRRIRHTGESIEGIASVKSYGWENPFFAMIKKLRSLEQSTISRSQALKAINKAFDYCVVPTSNLVMQWVYWLRGGVLDLPKVVFACLLFLQVLRSSVFVHWTQGVELGSEAIASCIRLESFLNLTTADKKDNNNEKYPEIIEVDAANSKGIELMEKGTVDATQQVSHGGSDSINLSIQGGKCFCYGKDPDVKSILSNMNLYVRKNDLVIVVGPVGAGKSSFLNVLLGELNQLPEYGSANDKPQVADCFFKGGIRPRVAFCPQIPSSGVVR